MSPPFLAMGRKVLSCFPQLCPQVVFQELPKRQHVPTEIFQQIKTTSVGFVVVVSGSNCLFPLWLAADIDEDSCLDATQLDGF